MNKPNTIIITDEKKFKIVRNNNGTVNSSDKEVNTKPSTQGKVQRAREYGVSFAKDMKTFAGQSSPLLGAFSVVAFGGAVVYAPSILENYAAVAVGAGVSYLIGRTVLTAAATVCYGILKCAFDLMKFGIQQILYPACKMAVEGLAKVVGGLIKFALFLPYHVYEHRTLVLSVALVGALAYFNPDVVMPLMTAVKDFAGPFVNSAMTAAMPYINQGMPMVSAVKDFVAPFVNNAATAAVENADPLIATYLLLSLIRKLYENGIEEMRKLHEKNEAVGVLAVKEKQLERVRDISKKRLDALNDRDEKVRDLTLELNGLKGDYARLKEERRGLLNEKKGALENLRNEKITNFNMQEFFA